MSDRPNPIKVVRGYLARGWNPIPVPYKDKNPKRRKWQKLIITPENVAQYFNGSRQNISVQLGRKSKGLTDVDLDCDEAIKLAPHFLPPTGSVFGRVSKPQSHHLYYLSDVPPECANIKYKDENGRCIVELRLGGGSKGAQSVFPGSTHESGEPIEWVNDGEPKQVGFAPLNRVVRSLAFAALLLRHWLTEPGSRHDLALAVGGFLARTGHKPDDISRLVAIVAKEAGDREFEDRKRAAADLATAFASGNQRVWGRPKLVDLLGNDVVKALQKFVGKSVAVDAAVSLEDFHAYMVQHNYIYMPTREPWPAVSVNARLGCVPLVDLQDQPVLDEDGNQQEMAASAWLDRNQSVEQMTWCPGLPTLIKGKLVSDGGWIDQQGVTVLNLYRPPIIIQGDPTKAGPWRDHLHKVFNEADVDHTVKWFAQRVQQPQVKINHALVWGGAPGIGKDLGIEPLKHAVGPWNFGEVSPQQTIGRFNGFLKSVVLRISEARDLGEFNRYQFYEHMKTYTAAPPDTLRVDEKNLREHAIFNCVGVIITTNYKANGIYLPANDRRHYVMWSNCSEEDFDDGYWNTLWGWYNAGGFEHVAAYLRTLDISSFDPKAPPPKTRAFYEIVDANRAPEDADLANALDKLGKNGDQGNLIWPDVVTLNEIRNQTTGDPEFREWLDDRKNRRSIPHRFETAGYVPVLNPARRQLVGLQSGVGPDGKTD